MSSQLSQSSADLSPRVANSDGQHIDTNSADHSATMDPSQEGLELSVFDPSPGDFGLIDEFGLFEGFSASSNLSAPIDAGPSSVGGPAMSMHPLDNSAFSEFDSSKSSYVVGAGSRSDGQCDTTNGFDGGELLEQKDGSQPVKVMTNILGTTDDQSQDNLSIDENWSLDGEVGDPLDIDLETGSFTHTEHPSALHTTDQTDGIPSPSEMANRGLYQMPANQFEGEGFSQDHGEHDHHMVQSHAYGQIAGPQEGIVGGYEARSIEFLNPHAAQDNGSLPLASQPDTQGAYADTNVAQAQNNGSFTPYAAQSNMSLPPAFQPHTQAVYANINVGLAPRQALVPYAAHQNSMSLPLASQPQTQGVSLAQPAPKPTKKLRSRWTDEDLAELEQLRSVRPRLSNKTMGEILSKTDNAVYLKLSRKYNGKFANPHKAAKERKRLQGLANNPAPM